MDFLKIKYFQLSRCKRPKFFSRFGPHEFPDLYKIAQVADGFVLWNHSTLKSPSRNTEYGLISKLPNWTDRFLRSDCRLSFIGSPNCLLLQKKKSAIVLDRTTCHTVLDDEDRRPVQSWSKSRLISSINRWGGPPDNWALTWANQKTKNLSYSEVQNSKDSRQVWNRNIFNYDTVLISGASRAKSNRNGLVIWETISCVS